MILLKRTDNTVLNKTIKKDLLNNLFCFTIYYILNLFKTVLHKGIK